MKLLILAISPFFTMFSLSFFFSVLKRVYMEERVKICRWWNRYDWQTDNVFRQNCRKCWLSAFSSFSLSWLFSKALSYVYHVLWRWPVQGPKNFRILNTRPSAILHSSFSQTKKDNLLSLTKFFLVRMSGFFWLCCLMWHTAATWGKVAMEKMALINTFGPTNA